MDAVPVRCLLLGLLCSLALAIDTTVPPEDLDGSGDDEDFSGSGFDGFFVDVDSKDETVYSTSVSTLVPTVEASTAAQEPEIIFEEEAKMEETTKSTETMTTHNIIEDLFAVDTVEQEATTPEATTSPPQQTTTADLLEEFDAKRHHHHHHPHHHTTSSTSPPPEPDVHDDGTTDIPPEANNPLVLAETTTSTPDEESEVPLVPQELTTPVQDLAKHGVLYEETTSGSTSTDAENKVTVEPLDADSLPDLDSLVTTTVAEDSPTTKHHHHHHHHHHHPHSTTSSVGELDVEQAVTTTPADVIELDEDDVQEAEHTTVIAEEEHPHHGHDQHSPHHQTTASPNMSTEPEQPAEPHTPEPKGRRVHVPDVRSTTAIPVINEDEHIPEDTESDDFTSSTVLYNVSRNPFDEFDESPDSKEEGPSGITDEDIFFEATVPVINKGRMIPSNPSTDDGTSDASHGIMERKELLAGIIAGGVAGLVFAAFLVAFVLYRMKKKDEGSYSLEEPKQSNNGYQKPREQREFYA